MPLFQSGAFKSTPRWHLSVFANELFKCNCWVRSLIYTLYCAGRKILRRWKKTLLWVYLGLQNELLKALLFTEPNYDIIELPPCLTMVSLPKIYQKSKHLRTDNIEGINNHFLPMWCVFIPLFPGVIKLHVAVLSSFIIDMFVWNSSLRKAGALLKIQVRMHKRVSPRLKLVQN